MIGFVVIALGAGGVAPCVRCVPATRRVRAPRDTADVVGDIVRAASSTEAAAGVWFDGMEPFAHPGLPDIVGAAADAGFGRVRLTTDAGALADPRTAGGVVGAGVRQLEVVVLGDSPTHDALSGRAGLHAAMGRGLDAFRAAAAECGGSVSVSGRVMVCPHNLGTVARAVADLASLGVHCVCVDAVNAPRSGEPAVRAALETAAANGLAGWVAGFTGVVPRPQERAPWNVHRVGG